MAITGATYREMVQDALKNLDQSGASFNDIKTYVFTNYHVKRGFANWVEHILKQMVEKGEVKRENTDYTLAKIPAPPKKNYLASFWHEEENVQMEPEVEQDDAASLIQEPSSSKAIRKFQAKIKKRKKKKPPSAYEIQVKERQEKECFVCERKGCTTCRKTPQEIFQTRQKLWAKALQEEALYLQKRKIML